MVGLSSAVTCVLALAGGEGGAILTEDDAPGVTGGGGVAALSDMLRIGFNVLLCAVFPAAAVFEGPAVAVGAAAVEVCVGEAVAGLDAG